MDEQDNIKIKNLIYMNDEKLFTENESQSHNNKKISKDISQTFYKYLLNNNKQIYIQAHIYLTLN